MLDIFVRFERGRDDIIGPTYGPYPYVQVTYSVLRAGDDDNELAFRREDGDWQLIDTERDETIFSDFIVFSSERT